MTAINCERNSPIKIEEEKQGIVSILGSNSQETKPPATASLRRTLSADMSSKKWLAQNGLGKPPVAMKKISSSAELSYLTAINDHQSSSSEEEDEQLYGNKVDKDIKDGDMWSIIVSNKKAEELPPPYVHHLVKKASTSLCSKSLEICTESLGSETGSDKVTLSQISDTVNVSDKVEEPSQNLYSEERPTVAMYNYPAASKKKMQDNRSFPPPIPLLAGSSTRPSLHMHSHRENGRLVLEAVSVPSTKKLQAHYQDGRLHLTFIQHPKGEKHVQKPKAVIFDQREYKTEDNLEDVLYISEQEMDGNVIWREDYETTEIIIDEIQQTITKQALPDMGREVMNIHRSALMMKKIMGTESQNPTRSYKLQHAASKLVAEYQDEKDTTLPQSLPPRPHPTRPMPNTTPAAASFNAYEYFWRTKPATTDLKNPPIHCPTLKNNVAYKITAPGKLQSYEQHELLVLRNCRKARSSLLSWDAYCIATT